MPAQSPLTVKALTVAKEIGLTRTDRLELAEQICCLPRRPASWNDLDDSDIYRIADALHGYLLIRQLLELS